MLKMNATLAKLEKGQALLEVEVDPAEVEAALDQAYQKLVRRVNIPGFRKGKAPRHLLERHVGRDALMREALDILLPHAYRHAVEETGIEPVGAPHFDVTRMEEGVPLAFRVTVDVRPEVRLGDYRSIRIPSERAEVPDEEVDRFLAGLQDAHARLVTVDGGEAAPGLFAWVSYEGTVAGRPVGGDGQSHLLDLSSQDLLPGLADSLAGARAGEEREVELSFPADEGRPELAGQSARLKVKVQAVARKEVPPLDDDFARSLGAASLEELRLEAKNRLTRAIHRQAEERATAQAVEAAVAQAEVGAIPASLIGQRVDALLSEWAERLRAAGLTSDQYFRAAGLTGEAFAEQVRARAEREIRTELVLEQVAREEGISASEDEVRQRLDKAGLPSTAAPAVRRSIVIAKAAAFLRETAKSMAAAPQAS